MWQEILKQGLVNTKKIMEQFNGDYGQRVVAQELKRYTNEDRLEVAGEKLVDIDVKMTKLQGREIVLEGDFELESGKEGTFEYTAISATYGMIINRPSSKRRLPPIEAARASEGMPDFHRGRTEIKLDGETTNRGTGSLNVFLTDIVNAVMRDYSEDYGDGRMAAVPRTDDDDGSVLDFGQGMDRRDYDPYGYGRGLREDFGSRKNKVSSWKDVLGARSAAGEQTRTTMKLFRELKEAVKGYNKRMDEDLELALTKEEIEEYFPSIDLERLAEEDVDMDAVLGRYYPFREVKFGNVSEIIFTFDEVPNAKEGGFTIANGAKFGVYASLNNRVMDNPSIGQSMVEGPRFRDFKRETNATPQEIAESTEDVQDFLELTESDLRSYLKRSQEGKGL